jgi:signal transduction histidine kinase
MLLACGLWVLLKDPRALSNITFSLVCGVASIWLFSFFMVYSSSDETEAQFWGKCVYVGVVYIPALVYHFCASLLHRRAHNRLIVSNYLSSTVFLLLIPTPYLIDGQHHYFWGYYPAAGILHPVFLAYFGAVGGLSLYQLYRGYRAAEAHSPMEAARLKYVFWAFAIGYVASLDFVQAYGHEYYPIGYAVTCVFALIVTSAIIRFQLMGGTIIPAKPRILPYLQTLGLIPLYAAVLLLIRLFTGSMHYLLAGILLATFLAFAGVLAGLQKRIEKTIERVLFRQRYDAYETLIEFSKAMVTILDLNALSSTIMATLSRVLGIERMSVFLLDKEKSQFYLASAHGMDRQDIQALKFSSSDLLPHYLSETRSIVVLEELRHILHSSALRPVIETLNLLDAEVCLPLVNKDRLIGFFNLGPRASRSSYSEAEINLLTTLAQNAAVALDNALLYEDLRRSQILMRRTDRLRSLETIAGGFAHEIRNPLTSIKTFVQLAPERKQDEEFIGQFSHVVLEDVHRIERLIQEILDYARYMEPKFAEEDLNEVVSSCLYFVEVKAESKGILIEKSLARGLPPIMVDRQQLKQVVLNLLLNALEAMGDLGGRLLVRTRRLVKPGGDGWIQIEVRDTGPGIAPADLDHIFDPFYTTKHQSDEREGTGLGLTIVHQIVQEHHGYIEVESQLGSGTTFYIDLPMAQPHVEVTK